MLKVAWQEVKESSISNCSAKAGFGQLPSNVVEKGAESPDGMTSSEFEEYVDMDSTLECHGELPN